MKDDTLAGWAKVRRTPTGVRASLGWGLYGYRYSNRAGMRVHVPGQGTFLNREELHARLDDALDAMGQALGAGGPDVR